MPVEFRLLGAIEAYHDGQPVPIGPAQLRCLLAVLLIEANRPVPVDRIVDRVWGARRMPGRPRDAVQHRMTLLRKAFSGIDAATIDRSPAGYRLTVDADAVDAHRFRSLLRQAGAAGQDERAAALLEQALWLWRGDPFTGLDLPWANRVRATLTEEGHAARLDLTDIRLRQGKHAMLLVELADQVGQHPLDERLAGQYLLALYRSGRQADALEHYGRLRHRLADQLGADPGPALQELHQRMLTSDIAQPAVASDPGVPRSGVPVPRQLPAPPRGFVGRIEELAQLDKALDTQADAGATVVICAIGGTGGIGKTWLALHWAHQHLDRFPDGQLHVDLRGYDPADQPLAPAAVARGFLDSLGTSPDAIPADLHAQLGLYRSLVADKRMLIVLDNARDTAQVASLLPGSPTCTVLITSRHYLGGLVSAHGARALTVEVLSEPTAHHLLTRHLGHDRIAAEPEAVADLLACCAGLPLALSIVAARATRHPDFPLAVLAGELRDRSRRLDALDLGDSHTTLRATLSWSVDSLSTSAAAVFGLLGLAPGPDIDVAAAASLTAQPVERIQVILRDLENASLIQQHVRGRYRMHDLVRLYAADRARDGDPAALRRLVDFYLHTAFSAERLLQPLLPPLPLGPPADGCQPLTLTDQATALAWFTAEYPNLQAVQGLAATRDWATDVWRLAWIVTTFLYRQGRFHDALAVWQAGEAATRQLDDPVLRTGTHQQLGAIFAELGQHAEALEHLTLAAQAGDTPGQAYTHHSLGWLWSLRGDNQRALRHAAEALRRYRVLGMPAGEVRELTVISWYRALLGEYEKARAEGEAALAMARQHQQCEDEALCISVLGYVAFHTSRHTAALHHFQQAATLLHNVGNTYYEATVLDYLGRTQHALDDTAAGCRTWQQALQLYQKQHRTAEAEDLQQRLNEATKALPRKQQGAGR